MPVSEQIGQPGSHCGTACFVHPVKHRACKNEAANFVCHKGGEARLHEQSNDVPRLDNHPPLSHAGD
jgi:hypothetical protein